MEPDAPRPQPPKAIAVDVVAAQPTEADRATLAYLRDRDKKELPDVVYLVKIRFESLPPVTSYGWALYVGGYRVPKYWGYKEGIYFKVFDPQFFEDHEGQALRFSAEGVEFSDTGLKLMCPQAQFQRVLSIAESPLPSQTEVLK